MKTKLALIILCAVGLFTGCKTGVTGIYPAPVWLPKITVVSAPVGEWPAGTEATFSTAWTHGAEPFTVIWTFAGGTEVESTSSSVPARTDSVSVVLANDSSATETFSGTVQVIDARGNTVSDTFTFTVQPANQP